MARTYVDIAFPTAVRSLFTYHTADSLAVEPGMRVWVPLRKEFAIGMVIRVHDAKPSFETRPLEMVLDDKPVMSTHLLQLADWLHRFYYCSMGEAIQAALPSGLNFSSEKVLKVKSGFLEGITERQELLLNEIRENDYSLLQAKKRWRESPYKEELSGLLKKGWLTIWEFPRQKIKPKEVKQWFIPDNINPAELLNSLDESKKKLKWVEAFRLIAEKELPAETSQLVDDSGISPWALKRIEKEGWIESGFVEVESEPDMDGIHNPSLLKQLTPRQQEILDEIVIPLRNREYKSFMIYGVTGSGKTEVYIHALREALDQNRGGLVLVPEIALTPQTVKRFYQIFGDQIAVLHSRLTDRERAEAWTSLKSGKKRIAIGPRSAVFAPVQNPGLIVVDEEHDTSYKQFDPAPRYHARDVAVMRAHQEGAVVLLGSATPGMVSVKAIQEKKHTLLTLPDRPSGAMPEVVILSLKEYKNAMRGPLTVELWQEIDKALGRKEQIIILYNRRGFASFLQCEECGWIAKSPESSTTLTYHKRKNILLDHYSGYSRRVDTKCELCGSEKLEKKGSGTQQVEEEIAGLFPQARLLRMDRDSTSGKHAHRRIYQQFLDREADILIGTQIVAKGLDFPNVTVVGVINADTELAFPSFRAGERMFQLLSQVAGRAGRAEKPGRVFVQTWKPDHPAIRCARTHDFRTFATLELKDREMLNFPPFSRMVVVHFKSPSWSRTQLAADRFCDAMRRVAGENSVMGPAPSVIEWLNGQYQWEANIRLNRQMNARSIENLFDRIFDTYEQIKPKGASSVRINVDVDAVE